MNHEGAGSQGTINAADEIIGRPLARGLGDHTAILYADQAVSFLELNDAVNRSGNALLAQGVGT